MTGRITLLALTVASAAAAQTIPGAVMARNEPHHHVAYQDKDIRVLRVQIPAHDTTLLHEHGPDYFWIAIGASEIVNAKVGAADAVVKSADGDVHYSPGDFAHIARNNAATPFNNISVELLKEQTHVHNLCEPALANSPLDCRSEPEVRGASDHPAFATDQLEVGVITIPPGSVMRPGSDLANAWMIAIDTIDVGRTLMLEGTGRWTGGVFRSTGGTDWRLRNRGTATVRLLAITPRRAP
ncbi:MAG TPA: hypothetical protein VIV65_04105 [Gemmatimonadaceae bacterium]